MEAFVREVRFGDEARPYVADRAMHAGMLIERDIQATAAARAALTLPRGGGIIVIAIAIRGGP